MKHTFDGDCKACQSPNNQYLIECLKGAIDFIRWDELIAMLFLWFFTIGMFGWWGLPIAIILHSAFFTAQGGATGDWHMDCPLEEYKQINCVAGKLNCEICHNDKNYGNK